MIPATIAHAATPLLRLAIAELVEDEKDALLVKHLPRDDAVQLARRWLHVGAQVTALASALMVLLQEGEATDEGPPGRE